MHDCIIIVHSCNLIGEHCTVCRYVICTSSVKRCPQTPSPSPGRGCLGTRLNVHLDPLSPPPPPSQYEDHEEVVLWMNTVGPYHNRQETYTYFSLPLCKGPQKEISHYHETLGEALQGVELEFSGLEISYDGRILFVEGQSCSLIPRISTGDRF